jgi:hypothetical protein
VLQRERDIANEIREELGRAKLRAERVEAMLRLAEAQAASVRRAGQTETVIERIVDAIRTCASH